MAENKNTTKKKSPWLTGWLWFAAVTVVIGVIMLYPIGTTAANVLFILVKIGMMAGILLFMQKQTKGRFLVWGIFSSLAVVMSLVKWQLNGAFDWTYALAIGTDIVVPTVGWVLSRK